MRPATSSAPLAVLALLLQPHAVHSIRQLQLHRSNAYDVSIKRNLHTNERHRRLDDGLYEVVPLNLGMGTHYTWIYAGTPPQRASVIVDTGSHQLACTGCGKHTDVPFDASKSSSLVYPTCEDVGKDTAITCASCTKNNTCEVNQMYSEGSSWKAVVVEDNVWLGDKAESDTDNNFSTRFRFGCQYHETGLFTTQVADGIMGLSTKAPTVIKKLFQDDKISQNVFSLCFTSTGGAMTVGSHHSPPRHEEDMKFAKVSFDATGWYALDVRGIRIHGEDIHIDSPRLLNGGRKVVIDSGTTDSYLPDALVGEFNRVFQKVMGKNRYLKKKANGRFYSSILLDEPGGGIIGANLMLNHDFVFDADRNRFEEVVAATDASSSLGSEEDYPLVLTLGGVAIALLFIVGMAVAVCKSKDPRWTQVNLNELDVDEEAGLVVSSVTEKEDGAASVTEEGEASYDTPPDEDDEFFNAQHEDAVDGADKAELHRMDL
ncbi:hypothetical protein DYB37_007064 [Aphanomyces astaci]|uniref:Peptidase A1 domain-containing protein n=1 Tax=Aphanomyces astaci TaxID=112090 RepID=A0A418FDK7_APHAT|nr:hypothetical protein DYB37_007064 [Aphanomyces astaci]RQM11109.1 hypothetical protein B5M09_006276 [Aphanomyces astaci]